MERRTLLRAAVIGAGGAALSGSLWRSVAQAAPAQNGPSPAFSPDGSRLYLSSQRGTTGASSGGITYEVRGPFRR